MNHSCKWSFTLPHVSTRCSKCVHRIRYFLFDITNILGAKNLYEVEFELLFSSKGVLISEGILALVPLPIKDAKSLSWAGNSNFLLRRVIWHLSFGNGAKVKIPSEIRLSLIRMKIFQNSSRNCRRISNCDFKQSFAHYMKYTPGYVS